MQSMPGERREARGERGTADRATPTPALLIACAREYIDTPWRHQARLRGIGVDCVGLLVCAARDAGLAVEDVPADYSTVPQVGWLLGELEARMVRVELHDMRPGDVLAFAWSLHPWHCGLVTAVEVEVREAPNGGSAHSGPAGLRVPTRGAPAWLKVTLIDAYRRGGKVLERPLDASWLAALHSAWRWPGFLSPLASRLSPRPEGAHG